MSERLVPGQATVFRWFCLEVRERYIFTPSACAMIFISGPIYMDKLLYRLRMGGPCGKLVATFLHENRLLLLTLGQKLSNGEMLQSA